jgi:uncharacterized protein YuzE
VKIKYDGLGDVLYLEFKDCTVTTQRISEDVAIDYDAEGQVAGIEILSASELAFGSKGKLSIDFENLLAKQVT